MQGQQGQGSTSNSYADNFGFNQQQLDILHQLWLAQQNENSDHDSSVRNGHNSVNGTRQSSSSMNNQNQISFVALLNEVVDDRSGMGQRLEGMHSENGQVGEGNISSAIPNNINIDLNATYEGNSNDLVLRMGVGLSLHPSKPDESEADRNRPAIDPSNPLLISSGIAGYVLEEGARQGDSPNGRRLSCKRRAPEGAPRQLLLGSSSSSAQQARDSDEQIDVIAQENTIISSALNNQANVSNLGQLEAGFGVGMGAASASRETPNVAGTVLEDGIDAATVSHQSSTVAAKGSLQGTSLMNQTSNVARNGLGPASGIGVASAMMHQASSRARQSENFQRNIRSRRNANQQDYLPASLLTRNTMNSQIQSPSQTSMFFPYDHFLNPNLPSPVQATPSMPPFMQVPNPFQTLQLSQGIIMPRARGSASASALAVNRRDTQRQEGNLINNPSDIFLHPELELGNLSHMATNSNLANGNTNFAGNAAAAAASSSESNRIPSAATWFANPIFNYQYSNGVADIASSSESRMQTNYFPRPAGPAAARREMENRSRPRLRRSRLMPRPETGPDSFPMPPILQPSSPSRRRGRQLLSEVHNALALVRRGGRLRFEDIMVIDHSMLLGLHGGNDIHGDMRLDIDDMTYEELLALGEEIGHVSTGLNEEAILANLRLQKHQSLKDGSSDNENDEPCCICQEEYADGEDIGKLDCGHDFHVNCIKQWLMQKNQCPICKMTGLAGKQREH